MVCVKNIFAKIRKNSVYLQFLFFTTVTLNFLVETMIVGYDAKRAFKNATGLGNYSRMLICGLASHYRDFKAMLYAPKMSGYYQSYFTCYANVSTRQPRGIDQWTPNLWRSFGVSMHLKHDKVDIYHGLSHELPHRIPSSIKKVVTMHDLVAWRYPQYFRPWDAWMYRLKQKHSAHIADIVVAISEQTKRDLIDIMHVPENKIRVLYQSCDPIFWDPISDETIADVRERYDLPERYFISVGTIEDRKNQARVVEAMKQLPEDAHLILVGHKRGIYGEKIQHDIASYGLSKRVRIIEDAEFEDFPALYAASCGSVYMSLFEGFGIPILEAMCSGAPVLTSNCSSMPEVGGDAVLYAAPDDVEAIVSQMRRLFDDENLRDTLRTKGHERKMKFSEQHVAEQFYKLYEELLSEEK